MTMKEERQQKESSRAIPNSERKSSQLKGFVDNRNQLKGFVDYRNKTKDETLPNICYKSVQCEDGENINNDQFDSIEEILQRIGKERLLMIIKDSVYEVGNELLAQINQTTNDCPYIRKWFTYYRERDLHLIIQAISKFAPLTKDASSLNEYISFVIDRVKIGLQKHINTGTVEDIPSEIIMEKEKSYVFLHIAQKETRTSQFSKTTRRIPDGYQIDGTKMVYKDLVDGNLLNAPGSIFFTLYKGGELLSSNFSGCIMAAFTFLKSPEGMDDLFNEKKFIAHVYCDTTKENDTKLDFYRYEREGQINIEAMYRPFNGDKEDCEAIGRHGIEQPGDAFLTGGMREKKGQWEASIYFQRIQDGKVVNDEMYKKITSEDLMHKTQELKEELAGTE